MPNVVVNLGVQADASGSVSIFAKSQDIPETNIVDATYELPVSALYKGPTDALLKFKGTGNDIEAAYGDNFTTTVSELTTLIENVLKNTLKAGPASSSYGDAAPFNDERYNGIAVYQNYPTIGDLALAFYADAIFGHVQATAAINNDTAVVNYINGNDAEDTLNEDNANIAYQIANTLKNDLDNNNISRIVEQVIGTDASRALDVDNDDNDIDTWQHLIWRSGDVIFFQITFENPIISTGADQSIDPATIDSVTYNIRVVLGDNTGGGDEGGDGGGGDIPYVPIITLKSGTTVSGSSYAITGDAINGDSVTSKGTFTYTADQLLGATDFEVKFTLDSNVSNANNGDILYISFDSVDQSVNYNGQGTVVIKFNRTSLGIYSAAQLSGTSVYSQIYPEVDNQGWFNLAGHILGIKYTVSDNVVRVYDYTSGTAVNILAGRTDNQFGTSGGIKAHPITDYKLNIISNITFGGDQVSDFYDITNIKLIV